MAIYCSRLDLEDYVLRQYLDKVEELNPGVLEKHIGQVSSEIDDVLRHRYVLPLATVPETIKRIAAVMVCYRSIGAITSLMSTEAASNNQFIYIQNQNKAAEKSLIDIRKGDVDLGLLQLGAPVVDDGEMEVIVPPKIFSDDMLGGY